MIGVSRPWHVNRMMMIVQHHLRIGLQLRFEGQWWVDVDTTLWSVSRWNTLVHALSTFARRISLSVGRGPDTACLCNLRQNISACLLGEILITARTALMGACYPTVSMGPQFVVSEKFYILCESAMLQQKQAASLTERNNRLAHSRNRYFWGYLAASDAKSDVMFLLGDPDFL